MRTASKNISFFDTWALFRPCSCNRHYRGSRAYRPGRTTFCGICPGHLLEAVLAKGTIENRGRTGLGVPLFVESGRAPFFKAILAKINLKGKRGTGPTRIDSTRHDSTRPDDSTRLDATRPDATRRDKGGEVKYQVVRQEETLFSLIRLKRVPLGALSCKHSSGMQAFYHDFLRHASLLPQFLCHASLPL